MKVHEDDNGSDLENKQRKRRCPGNSQDEITFDQGMRKLKKKEN